jgi:hypothetical protein
MWVNIWLMVTMISVIRVRVMSVIKVITVGKFVSIVTVIWVIRVQVIRPKVAFTYVPRAFGLAVLKDISLLSLSFISCSCHMYCI